MLDDTQKNIETNDRCRCNDGPINDACDELVAVNPVTRRQLRALAFHYIYAVDRSDYQEDLADVSARFLEGFSLKPSDNEFSFKLAQGVIDNRVRYGKVIEPLLEHWRFDRLGCCTQLVLYMALWEFEQPEAVASIVINEAVELAKAFAERDAYRLVNGILDQVKLLYPHSVANDAATSNHNPSSTSSINSSSDISID
ncbi:MAG: transcription antitermination protein NusB [Candidatus Dependentiae bacterium]|nr:transcription antitermination protein NusB [Candidatus Dependentiae bacterium]